MSDLNDKSLLDRLNALKPSSVVLGTSNNALDINTSGIYKSSEEEGGPPPSREDALAKRLKTLRNQRERAETTTGTTTEDPPPPYTETEKPNSSSSSSSSQPPLVSSTNTTASPATHAHRHVGPVTTTSIAATSQTATPDRGRNRDGHLEEANKQDLHDDNDKTLDEILESLVIEDDHWSVSEDGENDGPGQEQVEELLAKLRITTTTENNNPDSEINYNNNEASIVWLPSPPPTQTTKKPAAGDDGTNKNEDEDDGDEDDNSEGDKMSRQVDQILAQTMDELKINANSPSQNPADEPKDTESSYPDPEITLPTVPQDNTNTSPSPPPATTDRTITDDSLNLPSTPKALPDPPSTSSENYPSLSLPSVPTALQDPILPPNPSTATTDPFESSIASRLAALKGPNHKPLATDSLGLPSVPTSQPTDDIIPGLLRPRSGYTDADQKTWCVVCLEDGTVRCLDCEDGGEVYCARCWREMHVGPAAGYDERGHAWEKFDPRRR